MMARTIFYSWQSDTPNNINRAFIETAIEKAISQLSSDAEIEEALREVLEIDRDTKDVPGMPPIVETIFQKIDSATAFLADLTFIAERLDGRPSPNPNVLVEYGYALKSLTHSALVAVMNTHYGEPSDESLPFDMKHLRWPITFNLPPNHTPDLKKEQMRALVGKIAAALGAILLSSAKVRSPLETAFMPKPSVNGPSRYRVDGEALGRSDTDRGDSKQVHLAYGPTRWLRVMPTKKPLSTWLKTKLRDLVWSNGQILLPLSTAMGGGLYRLLAKDGYGTYRTDHKGVCLQAAVVFDTGEIWTQEVFKPDESRAVSVGELEFEATLARYAEFLRDSLGIEGPYRWEAGFDRIKNWKMWLPTPPGYSRHEYLTNPTESEDVMLQGSFAIGDSPLKVLKPFYQKVYDDFGFARPDDFDEMLTWR